MAVDKAQARELIARIDATFDAVLRDSPKPAKDWLKERIMGAAIREIERVVLEARPPVLYLLGRSGHGKSSLINALARREVARVGHVRPQTTGADPYFITFEDVAAEWQVIDSRGIFETSAAGAAGPDPVEQVKEDVRKYRPDVMLHVVTASEARALSNDFRAFAEIQQAIVKEFGGGVPTIMVLTKVDLLGEPDAWPPAQHPGKAGLVKELLDYVARDVLGGPPGALHRTARGGSPDRETRAAQRPSPIDPNATLAGYRIAAGDYIGVVPVSLLPSRLWNVETLADLVGRQLPEDAILDFAQALQRKELLRRIASRMTQRFSAAASAIGAAPIPIADIAVLTPLQVLLVALIAGLSCRRFSLDAATEFTAATGVNVGAAVVAREVARGGVKLLPGVGSAVSGAIAGATTYGLGKAAEAYFFTGETRRPSRFFREWRRRRKEEA